MSVTGMWVDKRKSSTTSDLKQMSNKWQRKIQVLLQSHQGKSKFESHQGILAHHPFLLTNYDPHADVEKHHAVGENTHEEASTNQHCPGDGGHPGSYLGTGHRRDGCCRIYRQGSTKTQDRKMFLIFCRSIPKCVVCDTII